MKKRILVFSADAMVCEDVDALRQLPNFQKYLAGGCEVLSLSYELTAPKKRNLKSSGKNPGDSANGKEKGIDEG